MVKACLMPSQKFRMLRCILIIPNILYFNYCASFPTLGITSSIILIYQNNQ